MKTTNVYVTCDTADLLPLKRAAERIANQKGCEPVKIPWPIEAAERSSRSDERSDEPAGQGSEKQVDKNETNMPTYQELARNGAASCDLFVAIVGEEYGKVLVPYPHDGGSDVKLVSSMHYELLQALKSHKLSMPAGSKPEILVFTRRVQKTEEVKQLLSAVPKELQLGFHTDKEFRQIFSRRLAEYQQNSLTEHLESLKRVKISITCMDKPGLLATLAEVINSLGGNLAGGSQTTKGRSAILQFVAEWNREDYNDIYSIRKSLQDAFSPLLVGVSNQDIGMEGTAEQKEWGSAISTLDRQGELHSPLEVTPIVSADYQFNLLLTFVITFVDQQGIADDIFTTTRDDNKSVLSTQVDTFLSGGIMLGRIQFSLIGDNFSTSEQSILEEKFRKLPGILHVDSRALRGRFWA